MRTIAEIEPYTRFIGRTALLKGGALTLDWSLSGISFVADFSDSKCTLYVRSGYKQRIAVEIDGEITERPLVNEGAESIEFSVPLGIHAVRLLKDTEVSVKGLCSELLGIEFQGHFLEKPEEQKMRMEIIGDSIASGLGVLGIYQQGKDWSFEDHSAVHSFAYLVPKALQAEAIVISKGGVGTIKDSAGKNMPDLYPYLAGYRDTETLFDFSENKTDLVLFELSGNDLRYSDEELKESYLAFLHKLRSVHGPEKPIVWVGKSSRIEAIVRSVKEKEQDSHLFLCQFSYGGSGSAALVTQTSGHPNVKEQAELADAIVTFLMGHHLTGKAEN